MDDNVVYFDKFKRSKEKKRGSQYLEGAMTTSERMERIKASIERINKLMTDLRRIDKDDN